MCTTIIDKFIWQLYRKRSTICNFLTTQTECIIPTSTRLCWKIVALEMPGYEVKFVHPLLKRHECPMCFSAMRKPVQTECGHLFCRDCLDPLLKRKRPICPLDQEEIKADSIFPDNACRREILNLEVYCPFVSGGCDWKGQLKILEVCSAII